MDEWLSEVMLEQACIEDCLEQMKINMRNGDYDLANDRCLDVQRSFRRLEYIQQKLPPVREVRRLV
ncbi:hypothetical protein [Psychrobacillus sp.]|uniref:hypothetical protein n=1 Tax=Psychrobacillus sp. TaxID=1871623 RepID=UPI0028BE1D4B|nr:hypothetical protein [Psychrobacillus sp.]